MARCLNLAGPGSDLSLGLLRLRRGKAPRARV